MRASLFILFLWSSIFSITPACFNDYASAAEKIVKRNLKAQAHYMGEGQLFCDFFPVTMFPFFCIPKDLRPDLSSYTTIYLCSFETSIYSMFDKFKNEHLIIASIQYAKIYKNSRPLMKIYTAYFFKKDPFTKTWIEERKPLEVHFIWSVKNQQYLCQ